MTMRPVPKCLICYIYIYLVPIGGNSHLATGKVLEATALAENALRLEDAGTKALAVVDAVAAIAKRTRVFFIAIILGSLTDSK
jgi:hypothetical protein